MIAAKPRFADSSILLYIVATYMAGALGASVAIWTDSALDAIVVGVALIGGVAIMLRPVLGLYALIFIVYINLSSVIVNVHGGPSIIKMFLPFLLVLIWSRAIIYRERFGNIYRILILLLLYGLLIASSFFYARSNQLVADGLEAFVKDAIMVLVIVLLLRRASQFRMVLWCLIAGGTFLGGISVFQQLTGTFSNNYGGFAQSEIEHIIGDINNYRIAGPVGTNFYAMIILTIVPLALDRLWSERNLWLKMAAAYAALICTMTVIFTFSRGGLISLGIAVGFWILQRRINLKTIIILCCLFLFTIPFVPGNYVERISTVVNALPIVGDSNLAGQISFRGRLSEQIAAWRMFVDNPFSGVGYDNYDVYYLEYSEQIGLDARREERQAHNLYLEVAAETGIVGVILFFSLLFMLFRGLKQSKQVFVRLNQPEHAGFVIAIQASVLGYLTSSLFLHAAHPRYFWLYVGIAFAMQNVASNEWLDGRGVRRFQHTNTSRRG